MSARTAGQRSAAWLTSCMRDVKTHKIEQTIRPYNSSGGRAGTQRAHDALPVRSVVATATIHRGEHIGTVKKECVLTGQTATELLQRTCKHHTSSASSSSSFSAPAASASPVSQLLMPVSMQAFDEVIRRVSHLPSAAAAGTPPHLLLSRDALLMTIALYLTRSPLHYRAVHNPHDGPHTTTAADSVSGGRRAAQHPLLIWAASLPRRPPPMGALLMRSCSADGEFEPLPRRLRLGTQTRPLDAGAQDVASAATELMVQAVESGEVALTDLQQPTVETALTPTVLTNYYKGRTSALTARQHATQRARGGAVERDDDAIQAFLAWEGHLQAQLVDTLLPALLLRHPLDSSSAANVMESAEWVEEAAVLRWAHFMVRSRAVNLLWRQSPTPQLAVVPLVDMLNHSADAANIVYHREADGDVAVTAARTIHAGEELKLRYNNVGQRGCLFGDAVPHTRRHDSAAASRAAARGGGGTTSRRSAGRAAAAAVAAEVETIEKRQYHDVYARDDDEDEAALVLNATGASAAAPSSSSLPHTADSAAVAHRECLQEVQWLWRYGFMRSADEKNAEAAQLWSRGLRNRIAHLTDVRRKGRPGEFVIGVPEGLQHLREQRAQLERERYANHRVFPPQQS